MRASAVNPIGAALAGIPVRRIWFATYILGGLMAGVAGVLILFTTGADYSTAFTLTIWGFGSAIMFGLRSPLSGFLGGLIIGITQALCSGYLPSSLSTTVPLIFIFVVLALVKNNQIATTGGRV